MFVIFVLFSIWKPFKNMKNASFILMSLFVPKIFKFLYLFFPCRSLLKQVMENIFFQNTKFHVMSWFNFNRKRKHSGTETWQHWIMLKEYTCKKFMQKNCNMNSLQALLYFLAISCKMWKQIIYDLILLNPNNTPKWLLLMILVKEHLLKSSWYVPWLISSYFD